MPTDIDMTNGRANMAYTGAKAPWHGLGAQLPANATLERWIEASGMAYQVLRSPVLYQPNGTQLVVSGKQVLYRSDSHAALGVVSDRYKPVQPTEVMEFFRDLTSDAGLSMETAGVLRGGAVYWALARTSQACEPKPGDRINGYVLLYTSADGSFATTAKLTSVRVVCANTLNLADRAGGVAHKTRHASCWKPSEAKAALGLLNFEEEWGIFASAMRRLAQTPVTRAQAQAVLRGLLKHEPTKDLAAQARSLITTGKHLIGELTGESERDPRGYAKLVHSYESAPGAVPGTAYGLVQGVTHFLDHQRGADQDKRLTSAWFGQGVRMKEEAVQVAEALAEAYGAAA